ncbi:MAG TPA: DUF6259 domain-containing protein [Verrucomicrobiae bacterium]|nr:DUF6259 domain-containing protein [Verrucomicrobiae bacterium]
MGARSVRVLFGLSVVLGGALGAGADEVLLLVEGSRATEGGMVVADVDLAGAAKWCGASADAGVIAASTCREGKSVPVQMVPAPESDGTGCLVGTLFLRLPAGGDGRLRLKFTGGKAEAKPGAWGGEVRLPGASVLHDPKRQGGFPSRITFRDGKSIEGFRWNDRLFDRVLGSFGIANDSGARVERLSQGPLGTVIRVEGRYQRADGNAPASAPSAIYDWFYVAGEPLVWVRATIRQREAIRWPEIHFLELNYPKELFPNWAGGEPGERGEFGGTKKSFALSDWGAILDGSRTVGMFQCGRVRVYDGGGGTYLHAHGDAAWQGWDTLQRQFSAWLWIGSDSEPAAAIAKIAAQMGACSTARVTVDAVRDQIDRERERLATATSQERSASWWRLAVADHLEAEGRFGEALESLSGRESAGVKVLTAGELGCVLRFVGGGVRLESLCDVAQGRQVLGGRTPPLFEIALRHVPTGEESRLVADAGWKDCALAVSTTNRVSEIYWRQADDARLGKLSVVAGVTCDAVGAMRWTLNVRDVPKDWSVWRVRFPQVCLAEPGAQSKLLFPRGSGEVRAGVWRKAFRFHGTYPSGWVSMQFMAAYDGERRTGLYVATHDPSASTKDISIESRPEEGSVAISVEHPAADMGVGANGFSLSGTAVWQLFRGDWFDAAIIYRDWVRAEARWYPRLGPEGRMDTPAWMRDLPAWAQTGGSPAECVDRVKEFAAFLGVPVGFHWYSWHRIPFDNDYPHYFPAKDGFAPAVRGLEAAGVHVMPYINGRLWDTRDRGTEDFEFTKVALPAASKDEAGKPYEETYGSKETDGSKVRLAAMCPKTALWQKTVRETVLQLFGECGVSGVYIDQVAAAKPALCFDRTHGHPLGGGHWWTEGYWSMLEGLRATKPADRILTTECNAEPYIQVFDGYLTWHWQYDGQVPAFPAVYGGAIQMFGRAYRGGPTKDLALRMKAGQQLVFGEQIGWLSPSVVKEEKNAAFLREVVRLRHALRRYFYAGEMARPPRLLGEIPRVTADWQWEGTWPVTTDALLGGAWRLPRDGRLAMIFVNVSDAPVRAVVEFEAGRYGMGSVPLSLTEAGAEGVAVNPIFEREITVPARSARAWELAPRQ